MDAWQPPPPNLRRPALEWSRDGQLWQSMPGHQLDELVQYMLQIPFLAPRVLPLFGKVDAGETVIFFPGREFEFCIRKARP